MIKPPKVLFIGLDAADPTTLAKGCDEGWLPVLKELRQRSAWAVVKGPRGFGDGAVWPSLFTGVNPGRHGRYFYHQLKLGTYEGVDFTHDTDFGVKSVWEHLSNAGRRVAVIDMVKAPLVKRINGIQINDWLVHSREVETRSSPSHLASEILEKYGNDPFNGTTDIYKQRSGEEFKAFRDAMLDRVQKKTALCEDFLKNDSWDLFMMAFGEYHDVSHQCWHFHDPNHALYDAQWVERYGDPVKDVYIALDNALGRLLEHVGPETTTIVFAGPGMEPNYTGNFLLDLILSRIDGRPDRDRNLIPHAIVSRLRPAVLKQLGARINLSKHMYSMSRRRFFAVLHNESSGAVRINMAGREPAGSVNPGADYESVCQAITRDLLELKNADTGKPAIKEVVRVSDECHGDRLQTLPDLMAAWSRDAPIRAVTSPKIGLVTANRIIGARTGDHNPDCVFFAHGPGVIRTGRVDPIVVEDIAPTIVSLLDTELPDCDGKPVSSIMQY